MMTLEQESRRGFEAQRLLENEIFKEAFASVRASIFKTWEDAPIRDREAHHELKLMLKLLKDLEATITRVVNDGKKAQFEIETIKKRDEIARKVSRFR
jgi:hypothetical protein